MRVCSVFFLVLFVGHVSAQPGAPLAGPTITETHSLQGIPNALTVTLRANADATSNFQVTVSGLTNSPTPDTSSLAIQLGFSGATVAPGTWTKSDGRVVFVVSPSGSLASTTNQVYTFQLINPLVPQAAKSIDIGVNSGSLAAVQASNVFVATTPPAWETKTISESLANGESGGMNTLTLSIKPNTGFQQNDQITISGLSTSSAGSVDILANGGSQPFTTPATLAGGSLVLIFGQTGDTAPTTYSVKFVLNNKIFAQAAVTPSISLTGYPAGLSSPSSLGTAIQGVSSVMLGASVTQSQPDQPGVTNTLTFAFTPNKVLAAGTAVTISGLTGSATPDAANLHVAGPKFSSTGNWVQSTGTLTLTTLFSIPAGQQVSVAAALTNPLWYSPAKQPVISISGFPNKSTDTTVLAITKRFLIKSVSESSTVRSAPNTLTFTVRPNIDLPQGAIITIGNLVGTGVTSLTGLVSSPAGVVTETWDGTAGTLLLTVASGQAVLKTTNTVITVPLANPSTAQPSRTPPTISSAGFPQSDFDGHVLRATTNRQFMQPSLSESTNVQGVANELTFKFTPNFALSPNDAVVVKGLTGSGTAGSQMTFNNLGGNVFQSSGIWNQNAGELTLSVSAASPALTPIAVSFTLKNPVTAQSPPSVTTESSSLGVASTPVGGNVFRAGVPLSFVTKTVSDSHSFANAANEITFSLRPNANIEPGTEITIKGLASVTSPWQAWTVYQKSTIFEPVVTPPTTAPWNLKFKTASTLQSNVTTVFSIRMQNPATGTGVSPTISATGVSDAVMDRPSSNLILSASSGSPVFTSTRLRESATAPSADNLLEFSFKPSYPLLVGDTVTISGLTGSQTPDNTVPNFSQLGPFEPGAKLTGGTLALTVAAGKKVPKDRHTTVSFTLKNPASPGTAAAVTISASGRGGALRSLNAGTSYTHDTGTTNMNFAAGDQVGASVAVAGDVNGDGILDFLFGAPSVSSNTGTARLVFLSGTGTVSSAVVLSATVTTNRFGSAVAGLGVLGGNTIVAVGAPNDNSDTGIIDVFALDSAGASVSVLRVSTALSLTTGEKFGAAFASAGNPDTAGFYVSSPGGSTPLIRHIKLSLTPGGSLQLQSHSVLSLPLTPSGGTCFGCALALVGDLNDDGMSELVVGAKKANTHGTDRGTVFLLMSSGSASYATSIELPDVAGSTSVNGVHCGAALAALGDIDQDGLPELAIGCPFATLTGTLRGTVNTVTLNKNGVVGGKYVTEGPTDSSQYGGAVAGYGMAGLLVGAAGASPQVGQVLLQTETASPVPVTAATFSQNILAASGTGTGACPQLKSSPSAAVNVHAGQQLSLTLTGPPNTDWIVCCNGASIDNGGDTKNISGAGQTKVVNLAFTARGTRKLNVTAVSQRKGFYCANSAILQVQVRPSTAQETTTMGTAACADGFPFTMPLDTSTAPTGPVHAYVRAVGGECNLGTSKASAFDVCADVDECALGQCSATGSTCSNVEGGVNCTCPPKNTLDVVTGQCVTD